MNKAEKLRKQFEREVLRLQRIVKEQEKKGFTFSISPIPQTPVNVTKKDVEAIRKVTPVSLRKLGVEGKKVTLPEKKKSAPKFAKQARRTSGVPSSSGINLDSLASNIERHKQLLNQLNEDLEKLKNKRQEIIDSTELSKGAKEILVSQYDELIGQVSKTSGTVSAIINEETLKQDIIQRTYTANNITKDPEEYLIGWQSMNPAERQEAFANYEKALKAIPENVKQIIDRLQQELEYSDNYITDLQNKIADLEQEVAEKENRIKRIENQQTIQSLELKTTEDLIAEKQKEKTELSENQKKMDLDQINSFIAMLKDFINRTPDLSQEMAAILLKAIQEVIRTQSLHDLAERLRTNLQIQSFYNLVYSYDAEIAAEESGEDIGSVEYKLQLHLFLTMIYGKGRVPGWVVSAVEAEQHRSALQRRDYLIRINKERHRLKVLQDQSNIF